MVVRDKVSIVIPCRNESRYIAGCINSCLLNSYPGHLLEIIVVDGMSDDGTPEIIQKEFGGNKRVKLLENPQRFTPLSLNMGINNSDAEFIMILGAHSTISADYVEKCVGILKTHSDTGGCGGVLRNICEDASTEVISMAMSSPFGVGTAHFRTGYKSGYVDTVAFAIYKREVFDKVGLFDERLTRNQDDEFNFRVTKAGFKMYLESEVTANYFVRSSFSRLYRQYYQYGYWKVFVNRLHGTVTTFRQLVPPAFVLGLFGLVFLSLLSRYFFGLLIICMCLYLLGAFFAALQTKANSSRYPALIFSFFVIHFSYGLGYLKGIWEFAIMGRNPSRKQETLTR